jgi:hypothetical protein
MRCLADRILSQVRLVGQGLRIATAKANFTKVFVPWCAFVDIYPNIKKRSTKHTKEHEGCLPSAVYCLLSPLLHRIAVGVDHLHFAETQLANSSLNLFAIADDDPDKTVGFYDLQRRRVQV